jgi:Putative peptidoglycan binding domain
MKAKLLIMATIVAFSMTTPAFAKHRVVQTRNGRAIVTTTHHSSRSSSVYWNVGVGVPFYGGYYGGYPSYYGSYYSGYPYYGSFYYGGYPYGYNYYPYGYNNAYYGSSYPYSYNRYSYRTYGDSIVVRVQERLARSGYYRGPIDGVIGPRTQYAIRAYERSHGLPPNGIIDHRLLRTMGLA